MKRFNKDFYYCITVFYINLGEGGESIIASTIHILCSLLCMLCPGNHNNLKYRVR